MPANDSPIPGQVGSAMRCTFCPCGHVCLRWRRNLLLHFDQGELVCALDCLRSVLKDDSCGFNLGAGSFSACRATDGYFYLLCQDHVVLRLSEDEAQNLHSELASARAALAQNAAVPAAQHLM